MTEHLKNGAMKDNMRNIHRSILRRLEIKVLIILTQQYEKFLNEKPKKTLTNGGLQGRMSYL